MTLAVAGPLTIDPAAGVRTAGGNVVLRSGGDFNLIDPRSPAEKYTTPLIDLGVGSLTVFPGLSAAATVTIDAEVRGAGATFGVPGGGNDGSDLFKLRPSALTPFALAGNAPTIPLAPNDDGDELKISFLSATVKRFQYDGQDGLYQFTNRQQIVFTGIETLARFGIAGFVVQTGEPNDATGATRQQYAVRMVRTQDGVPLGGGIDGSGLAENPFVVSPVRVSTGTALAPPRITFADVNGDGVQDLILANGPGTAPLVSVIDGLRLDVNADGTLIRLDALPTDALLAQFFAYDPTFLGGVNLAAGDLNGDGRAEIVTAADNGGGPHVRTFTFTPNGSGAFTAVQFPGRFGSFFAFEPSFRGGAQVAVGDFDGDLTPDLIIGAGVGGGPRVQVFDVRTAAEIRTFFAYDDSYRGGVFVDAGDYDQDGVRGRADRAGGRRGGGHPRVLGEGPRPGRAAAAVGRVLRVRQYRGLGPAAGPIPVAAGRGRDRVRRVLADRQPGHPGGDAARRADAGAAVRREPREPDGRGRSAVHAAVLPARPGQPADHPAVEPTVLRRVRRRVLDRRRVAGVIVRLGAWLFTSPPMLGLGERSAARRRRVRGSEPPARCR